MKKLLKFVDNHATIIMALAVLIVAIVASLSTLYLVNRQSKPNPLKDYTTVQIDSINSTIHDLKAAIILTNVRQVSIYNVVKEYMTHKEQYDMIDTILKYEGKIDSIFIKKGIE